MPTPKQMLWIVGLAGATFFAIERYKDKASAGGGTRYGR